MNKLIQSTNYILSSSDIAEELKNATSYRDPNFKNLLDQTSSAYILTCPQGNILHANKMACKILGYTIPELKKIKWDCLISSAEHQFQQKLNDWRISNLINDKEKEAHNKMGFADYDYKALLLKDTEGNVFNLTIFQDPRELRLLNNELTLLSNNSEEGYLLLDRGLQILSYNKESARLFNLFLDKTIVKGTHIFAYSKPERETFLKELYTRILDGERQSAKICYNDKKGKEFTFIIKYQPARDECGEIIGVFISFKDVSKEEEHLKELQRTQEALRKIMDSSLDIICSLDNDGCYVQISAAAERIWGFKVEEIIGRHYSDFVTPDFMIPTQDTASKLRDGIELRNFENRIVHKNGNIISMEWSANWDKSAGLMYCVGRDITEKKLAESKLLQSEQRFKSLIQDGADLLGIMDKEGNLSYISPTSYSVLQYHPEELENKKFFDYIHPDDLKQVKRDFRKLLRKHKLQMKPFRYRNKNQDWCWMETTITNLLNDVAVNGFVFNARDITDRIKYESDIKFSARLLNTIGQAAIATNLDGTITYWNKAAETIYGYTREEAVGENIMHITLAPGTIGKSSEIMEQIAKGESWTGEFIVRRKDNSTFPALITNTPVQDRHGKVWGIIGISSDITERKIAEKDLELANERHNLILKATNEVVWDWDLETNQVVRSAENMKKLFGYDANEVINTANFWSSHVHPEEQEKVANLFEQFINNPKNNYVDCEYRFKMADGNYAYVHDKGYAIRDSDGKAIRMIGSVKDVSYIKREEINLKLINEELVQQAKELAFSNRELEQFAYVASHDLQEPLRMVSSFLTQIERKYEPLLDEKGKRYIHFAVDGAKRMRQIILDLLEYSRAGNKEDKLEDVNLESILKEVKALLRRKIEDKQALISSDPLPVINAHVSPMRQVFQNLISNALLYSRDGVPPNIKIKVKELESHWQFEVSDNGMGISAQYFDKIFVIFQRLHGKDSFEGTGVGLAVTKKIVDNYGGEIWLESILGEGSSFYFTINK